MKNEICFKYDKKINDELASSIALNFNEIIEKGLQIFFHPAPGKEMLRDVMLDHAKAALKTMDIMRFVYLCSLFEGFSKEYISQRSSVPVEEIKTEVLNKYNKVWSEYSEENKLGSNSLLNLNYVNFIFKREYGLSIEQDLNKITHEIGALRNVIIHHDGKIPNDDFVQLLKNTFEFLNIPKQIGQIVKPTDKMMWIYIDDLRKIFRRCDDVA